MADHGINVSRADTAVATPNVATCGIPFVIGNWHRCNRWHPCAVHQLHRSGGTAGL